MLHKDFLVRQIQLMTEAISCVVFIKETATKNEAQDEIGQTETDLLYVLLSGLLAKNSINKAEDLLFEMLDPDNRDHYKIAMDFYNRLNTISNEELENADFSREETERGLNEVKSIFGQPDEIV